jgi:hypothetical protein
MRVVIQKLIERYRNNPIQKSEQIRQTFKLPAGTKARIEKLIDEGNLTLSYQTLSWIDMFLQMSFLLCETRSKKI